MYVNDLNYEIKQRALIQNEIEASIDDWIKSNWGIEGFSRKIKEYLSLKEDGVYGALCRQIATNRIEDLSFYATSREIGIEPISITFESDSFSTVNQDKISLLKRPIITGYDKKGNPIIQKKKLIDFPKEGTILKSIDVLGKSLPEYHRLIRQSILPNYKEADIGEFFNYCLREAKNKPDHVYEKVGDIAVKKPIDEADLSLSRPPASWYYPLYLSMFVSGKMVLFETYEDPNKEVEKIKGTFKDAIDQIKNNCGFYPLIIKTSSSKEMLYYKESIDWENISSPPLSKNCEEIFKHFAEQIISSKKVN